MLNRNQLFEPDFKALFESSPRLFLVLLPTPRFLIVAVSDQYLDATMTKREEIMGRGLFEVFPANPDDPQADGVSNLRASLEKVNTRKTSDSMPVQKYDIRRPDSQGGGFEERFWNPLNSPVLDQQGEIRYIIHEVEDVTGIVKAKAERDEARSAVNELEIEKDLREQFVSMLSHDLRTPLSAVKITAQVLGKGTSDPSKTTTLIGRIIENINRADQMITNLLDANRIRAGEKLPLEIQETGLYSLIQDTLEELASIHGDRFVFHSESVVNGYWSLDGLRRVIENLCSNAVKYGYSNTPISVSVQNCGDSIKISVQNEGDGLEKEELASLFTQYHRGKNALSKEKSGWGLGLTLVQGITEAHGGSVKVESKFGEGVTFTVAIPKDSRPFQNEIVKEVPSGLRIRKGSGSHSPLRS